MLVEFPVTCRVADDLGQGSRLLVIERSVSILYRVQFDLVEILGVFCEGRNIAALVGSLPEG